MSSGGALTGIRAAISGLVTFGATSVRPAGAQPRPVDDASPGAVGDVGRGQSEPRPDGWTLHDRALLGADGTRRAGLDWQAFSGGSRSRGRDLLGGRGGDVDGLQSGLPPVQNTASGGTRTVGELMEAQERAYRGAAELEESPRLATARALQITT
jgi:hypothetical protein